MSNFTDIEAAMLAEIEPQDKERARLLADRGYSNCFIRRGDQSMSLRKSAFPYYADLRLSTQAG